VGGRSRVAAQMLAGKGFSNVINLSGGIKGWNGESAIGGEALGLDLFTGNETPEESLKVAYGLEAGLRDFYLSMIPKVNLPAAKDLFQKLSEIEVKHQDRIFSEYIKITGSSVAREEFDKNAATDEIEGGLTTEEYVDRFKPDWDSPGEIISLAMSIEGQALDLYMRAADRTVNSENRDALIQIAGEERAHLAQLGKLMESI
jgi:rubrerythrin